MDLLTMSLLIIPLDHGVSLAVDLIIYLDDLTFHSVIHYCIFPPLSYKIWFGAAKKGILCWNIVQSNSSLHFDFAMDTALYCVVWSIMSIVLWSLTSFKFIANKHRIQGFYIRRENSKILKQGFYAWIFFESLS